MNPYEVLGIDDTNCTPAQIVRAYKQACKKAHPDREGGSEEQMSQVNQARDILLNPERKQRFDETGSTSGGPPTMEEQATLVLGTLFQAVLDVPSGTSWFAMVQAMIQELHKGMNKAEESQREHPKRIERARKLLTKFDCSPALRSILERRIEHMEKELVTINNQIQLGKYMFELVKSIKAK